MRLSWPSQPNGLILNVVVVGGSSASRECVAGGLQFEPHKFVERVEGLSAFAGKRRGLQELCVARLALLQLFYKTLLLMKSTHRLMGTFPEP